MTQNAGIGAAGPSSPGDRRADVRNANLAKARAARAANLAAAKAEAQAETMHEAEMAIDRASLGVSAARKAQQRPGTVVGHTAAGRVIVIGRDGKPISRSGNNNIDKFAIPKEEIPMGWSYQWIAETVYNEPQTAAMLDFRQKQWTPVPQERHPDRPVRQGGLILVERPAVLTQEARNEEMQEAKDQVRANIEQFQPPGGMTKTGKIRKGKPVSVDADGVAAPQVEIAGDE